MPPEQPPKQTGDTLKTIRTYEQDVAELLKRDNSSLAQIAIKESNKKWMAPKPSQNAASQYASPQYQASSVPLSGAPTVSRRTVFWILVTLILLATGGFAAYYFLRAPADTLAPVSVSTVASKVLSVPINDRATLLKRLRDGAANTSGVSAAITNLALIFDKNPDEKRELTLEELLSQLAPHASQGLVRSLVGVPTFGIYSLRSNYAYFMLNVDSYDQAYEGMLKWEKFLLDDVGPVFGVETGSVQTLPATTTDIFFSNQTLFKDTIVRNVDARAVFDKAGKIILVYSFVDKEHLVIAQNDEVLTAVIRKLADSRYTK